MILKVQNVVGIFGWVACFIAFISVFFPYWKTIFKQSRYLAICRALKLFLIAISTNPRQLGGSIGKVPRPSIASRQLVDWSRFCYCVFAFFLDTFSTAASVDVVFLDTFLDKWLDTSICRELLRIYIFVLCDPNFIFSWSLSWYLCLLTSQITLSHFKQLFKWFSIFFKVFLHLVSS